MKLIRKYIIYSLLFVCSAFAGLHAQTSPRMWLGVHGGVDIGTFSFDPAPPNNVFSSKTGFAAGGEFDYWFSNNFGVCYQASYVQKGFREKDQVNISFTFPYIQVPILFKATIGNGSFKPVIFFGPEIGFRLSATATGPGNNRADTTITFPDSLFTKTNFGIMVGAGITYNLNPTTLFFLSAAYDYGVSNLNPNFGKSQFGSSSNNDKWYTRDIRMSLGVLIAIEKSGE